MARGLRADRVSEDLPLVLVYDGGDVVFARSSVLHDALDDVWTQQFSIVGDAAIGRGQLDCGNGDALSDGRARLFELIPFLPRR